MTAAIHSTTKHSFIVFLAVLISSVASAQNLDELSNLSNGEPDQTFTLAEEAFIATPLGFDKPGKPQKPPESDAASISVTIVDQETKKPIACRVNVVGADGHFYEPQDNPLFAWSRERTAINESHSPSRYWGWYFYTTGQFTVEVPAGATRIEVWKGMEYHPEAITINARANETRKATVELKHTLKMHQLNYFGGDTHIHFFRRNEEDDARALDLVSAEDIRYAFILAMNIPNTYSGIMSRQEWPQDMGFGDASVKTRGVYGIASGQEYRAGTYGHISFFMHKQLALKGLTVDPNNFPTFGMVSREVRKLGGYSFHCHGGYEREIYADYIQQATDGVELLQMAHYRGIGLTGWYHMLNMGFRFPSIGACDFPYVRALGDCRTYAYAGKTPTHRSWSQAIAEGRSFITTGPMLILESNGARPGDTLELRKRNGLTIPLKIKVAAEISPIQYVQIIVNGNPRTIWSATDEDTIAIGKWREIEVEVEISEPSWIAARAFSISPTGRPDGEAHTNPLWVYLNNERPFDKESRDWLLDKLDGRISALKLRKFAEQPEALRFFEQSRKLLENQR